MKKRSFLLFCCSAAAMMTTSATFGIQVAFEQSPMTGILKSVDTHDGFTLQLLLDLNGKPEAEQLLQIPGVMTLELRNSGDNPDLSGWDWSQNYRNYKFADGSCPVLEAELFVTSEEHPDWKSLRVGFPLSRLDNPQGQHEIQLHFTGVSWQIYVDGKRMDENFPFGYPVWNENAECKLQSPRIQQAVFHVPNLDLKKLQPRERQFKNVQYFTPAGHNTWVGDVVPFFHDGRYHIFYLYDRRNHTSKFGQGGHYYEHLSSTDLIHWTEHPTALELSDQSQSFGTGTVLYFNDTYILTYGIHSTRIVPYEKTALPIQWNYLEKHGKSGIFPADELQAVPAGSTYAVSKDGIHFEPSGILMHPCENPSTYVMPDGSLMLLAGYGAKGTWVSDRLGNWVCKNPDFPLCDQAAPMRNSTECQNYFTWNGYHYIIAGLSGFWFSSDGQPESYVDLALDGEDIYDGLGVPMVAPFTGNRRIMAGWLAGNGYGGHLILREMVQHQDGRLGLRWLEEAMPQCSEPEILAESISSEELLAGKKFDQLPDKSFMLTMTIDPGENAPEKLAVRFTGRNLKTNVEFQLQPRAGRAQIEKFDNQDFASAVPTAREIVAELAKPEDYSFSRLDSEYLHFKATNFAIEKIRNLDEPFELRFFVYRQPKINGSLLDVEIAGIRTMISNRNDLFVDGIELIADAPGAKITNVAIAPVAE